MRKNVCNVLNGVYILLCSDGTFYTGMTCDITHRFKQHQMGEGARYTRSRLPVKLAFYENGFSHLGASRAERWIKKLGRSRRKKLIKQDYELILRLRKFKDIKQPVI